MHYMNGRKAQVGDTVVQFSAGKAVLLGVLVEATPGSTSCNGRVIPKPYAAHYVTLSECAHESDVEIGDHVEPKNLPTD